MKRRSSGSSDDDDESPVDADGPPADVTPKSRPRLASRPSSARSRRSSNLNWKPDPDRNAQPVDRGVTLSANKYDGMAPDQTPPSKHNFHRAASSGPWSITLLIFILSTIGISLLFTVVNSLITRQLDPKGCRMSYMRPFYAKFADFDSEHTRFATKYSLYLYREQGIDDQEKLRGIPVLFIPGNAGSYKQVRPIAAEAANYFHDVLQHDEAALATGALNLDFFTVDFNEDITAFHGQTLLDQAEYLNEAIRYILSLYMDPRRSSRDSNLPDPTSVIILGHSMGGVVARTMLIMPNYQSNSINTIITMSAPHSRPPVTFDGQIVKIYEDINSYWRQAYSQKWANDNPLWHVTLVSIAGGGLDTVVPSDYASLESLVPETHGFTVFTSTIPTVWTSMDHQAILWCDQFRKVISRALYDAVDVHRASQTKPRAERMRVFKKWFLTGMEAGAEKSLPLQEPTTLLTLGDGSNTIVGADEILALRMLGTESRPGAYLLPVPPHGSPHGTRFTLLTDALLDRPGEHGKLEVLLCSVFSLQPGQATMLFSMNMNLSTDSNGSTRLACKNAAADFIMLPASTQNSRHPFTREHEERVEPFSYLQYDLEVLADHQFVAVVDKAASPTAHFVLAQFTDHLQSHRTRHISLWRLLALGTAWRLPPNRPMVTEVRVPQIQSSLLAYKLEIGQAQCGKDEELFAPLLRQYLSRPYESKYFVNARHVDVSIHGVSPFVPPAPSKRADEVGLGLQFWIDPTCESGIHIKLTIDVLGSMGKLYMRYRTVFAAFPLLVVAFVLRKQFQIYDTTGLFISFSESLDLCLHRSLPLTFASLTLLSVLIGNASPPAAGTEEFWQGSNGTSLVDFHQNDRLTGTRDSFFWFLVPLVGVVCVGVCVILHYVALALTQVVGILHGWLLASSATHQTDLSPHRRMITTAVLLFLVSTFIPYQFAYLVACLVQLFTTARALRIASELSSNANYNFYNYAHSILLLMLWVLPINLPILAVWVRNLAVHWLTPFSSHHNVLSVISFILLVENLTTGKMIPRAKGRLRHVTTLLFFGTALSAALYGVSHAYMLHHLVHLIACWLVLVHFASSSWSLAGLRSMFEGNLVENRKRGKTP